MTIKEDLESQKGNLQRAGRIRTYLIISELVWIAFATIVQVWQDSHNYGLIIAGVFAIGFFWLFIQQKMITNIYLSILSSYLGLTKTEENKQVMEHLAKESTEEIDPDEIPSIKELSKAKSDEELI